jgi:hypothetical protein
MVHRPAMIRDQDRVEIRLTREAEYRIPFTFIEALNEGTLFDRPAHVFRDCGLITRSDGAGDIRVTVDFSHVIPRAHLDAQVERSSSIKREV